jgi:DnaA-homolog protein
VASRSSSTTASSIAEPAIKQIALALTLDRQFSFDNFVADHAELIVSSLRELVLGRGEIQIGLWGAAASGKTHLLNASAEFARQQGVRLQIYDGLQLCHCAAEEFEGFEHCDVLAIDNLDALAGDADWEACFYQVINRCRDGEFRLLFSLSARPEALATRLHDFRSRLQWGLLLHLPSSGDAEIRQILRRRARLLGIELSDEVIAYLMNHHARDLGAQIDILRRLDGISLTQQRRVTIPLVKQALRERAD